MDAKGGPDPLGRAGDGLKRAVNKLINLLKSPDGAVRAGAADAPRGLDPPPVWALLGALTKAKEVGFKIEIIEVLGGLGEAYRTHLLLDVGEQWRRGDRAVRPAILRALQATGSARGARGLDLLLRRRTPCERRALMHFEKAVDGRDAKPSPEPPGPVPACTRRKLASRPRSTPAGNGTVPVGTPSPTRVSRRASGGPDRLVEPRA